MSAIGEHSGLAGIPESKLASFTTSLLLVVMRHLAAFMEPQVRTPAPQSPSGVCHLIDIIRKALITKGFHHSLLKLLLYIA